MQICPDELERAGYTRMDSLQHDELIPFIQTYLKKRTGYSIFYHSATVVLLLMAGYLMG